jgi:hypothetical protein
MCGKGGEGTVGLLDHKQTDRNRLVGWRAGGQVGGLAGWRAGGLAAGWRAGGLAGRQAGERAGRQMR